MALKYIFHFDELTWMPEVITRPFTEIHVSPYDRPEFLRWLDNNTQGKIFIWPGVLTPDTYQTSWGNLISPHHSRAFIIFMDDSDQARFNLEFVGMDSKYKTAIHKDGFTAYYHIKSATK